MSLAKLRKHAHPTVLELDASTTRLGTLLRKFVRETGEDYDTRELPKEAGKRARDKAARDSHGNSAARQGEGQDGGGTSAKQKKFNMTTVKMHGLGHTSPAIFRFGSLEGFSTMTVSY